MALTNKFFIYYICLARLLLFVWNVKYKVWNNSNHHRPPGFLWLFSRVQPQSQNQPLVAGPAGAAQLWIPVRLAEQTFIRQSLKSWQQEQIKN